MRVVAVIPTTPWTRDYAQLCVQSLLDTTDWMIVVVVNGDSLKVVSEYKLGIEDERVLVISTPVQGQCHAVNRGASMLGEKVDYLFVSNDDMYYAPGWLNEMRYAEEPPIVWSPNLVEPTNNHGSAEPFLKLDAGFTLDEFDRDKVDEFVVLHEDNEETTGFNLPFFIKKEVWDTIGGYDEKYDPWGSNSDTDLQTKIELAGIQPMRIRDVLVYHFSNKSGTFGTENQSYWQRNWNYYTEKWGFNRDDEPKPDTWMATNLVNKEKNIYHPEWEGKYE